MVPKADVDVLEKRKSLLLTGTRTVDCTFCSVVGIVAVPTTLLGLHTVHCSEK